MTRARPPAGFSGLVTAPFPALADASPVLRPEVPWSCFEEKAEPSLAQR